MASTNSKSTDKPRENEIFREMLLALQQIKTGVQSTNETLQQISESVGSLTREVQGLSLKIEAGTRSTVYSVIHQLQQQQHQPPSSKSWEHEMRFENFQESSDDCSTPSPCLSTPPPLPTPPPVQTPPGSE